MAPTALPPLDKLDPAREWQPWQPSAQDPWSLKWAGHLYRRAAFGANLTELRKAEKQGLQATLDLLLNGDPKKLALFQYQEKAGATAARKEPFQLRVWWVYCMLNSGHPLREKLTLFWHNHFATSINKVKSPTLMYKQNVLLRKHALGKFGAFLLEMSKDPAMLIWLDSNSNVKAHPNENYAREVMELFSLGVHGGYTEKDIREAARAFTGWHTDGEEYEFNAGFHDEGSKNVLGQKGNWDGGDIVRILLEHPSCARFLVSKLYRNFVSENQDPPVALIEPLCEQLRKSQYDLRGLVRTLLSSRHFFSEYAFRQRIKSPVELVLGAAREVCEEIPASDSKERRRIEPGALVTRLESMGQELFAPPNVKGWYGAQAWLNTSTILTRQNYGQSVAMGTIWNNTPSARNAGLADFVVDVDEPEPTTPGAPVKPGAVPSRPEEPPPAKEFDPARVVREQKLTNSEDIVRLLLDIHLPGGVSDKARAKLVAFVAAGKLSGNALDRRVRETVHAIMCMPDYQLA